jgi:glycosyltransferase involved in cell wall biosynthesis
MDSTPKQRILYVDSAPFSGGAQESLLTLMEGVAVRGWEPLLAGADHGEHGLLARCRQRGWRVYELRTSHWRASPLGVARLGLDRLAAGRVLRRALAEAEPALIHANGVRSGLLLPGGARGPVPVILHDRDLRVPRLALGWLAGRVGQVLAISRCVAAKWHGQVPAERLHVVPNGFDLGRLAATPPAAGLSPAAGRVWVALVADLEPWKRHDVFLEAVAQCVAAGADLGALVVGRARTPAASRYLHRLQGLAVTLGIATRVRWVSTAASALPWLAAADVVVSAALAEPFGRTIIEALALGRPVVAVNACGPGEILAGCPAATLTEDTAAALAAGIREWLSAERRNAAVGAAREWAARYERTAMLDSICELYRATGREKP